MIFRFLKLIFASLLFNITCICQQPEMTSYILQAYHLKLSEQQEGFTSDTLVLTLNGYKPIVTIQSGEQLKTINNALQQVFLNENCMVVYVYEIITKEHRFQVAASQKFFECLTEQWIKAQDLQIGQVIGLEKICDIKKVFAIKPVYKLTTEQHEFLLYNGLIRVHNANIFQAAGLIINLGRVCLQHPVITRLTQHTISLTKLALQLYQLYEHSENTKIIQQAIKDDDVVLETRLYYQSRRIELFELLQQYKMLQQDVLLAIKQTSALNVLTITSKVVAQSMLLPDKSIELSYSIIEKQKLLECREIELRKIEQEIESIQISLALYTQDLYERLIDADVSLADIYIKTQTLLKAETTRNNAEQKCFATLVMLESLDYLKKICQEVTMLLQFYQHSNNAKLLKESSNIQDLCIEMQNHLTKINNVFTKTNLYVVGMQQSICSACIKYGLVAPQKINNIQQQLSAQRQENEKRKNNLIKIKQSNIVYPTPPDDPEDKKNKNSHTAHPHNDKSNHFPTKEKPHGLRNDKGHIPDTPENRQKILDLVKDKNNRVALDRHGNMWYAKTESDGSQLWASVRIDSSEIQNCGLNLQPRIADPETGLCTNISKSTKG